LIYFSKDTKNRAFIRSGLKCECTHLSCGHVQRCGKPLYRGNWQACPKKTSAAGGNDSLENCEILCNSCYEKHAVHRENNYSEMPLDY